MVSAGAQMPMAEVAVVEVVEELLTVGSALVERVAKGAMAGKVLGGRVMQLVAGEAQVKQVRMPYQFQGLVVIVEMVGPA